MKQKTFFIIFEGLWFGEKYKFDKKIADTSFKSSSTFCFKYFAIISFEKWKKDKYFRGSWAACRLLYLYMKQAN